MRGFEEKVVTADDGLRIYYRDYNPDWPGTPILCLHGLSRNSADFEDIAEHLRGRFRVLAMDVRGRGRSDWDENWQNYHPGTYVADAWRLLDQEDIARVIVIGTSMGGLMGMIMGATHPERIKALILNDVGPELAEAGVKRIAGYVGKTEPVTNWEEARAQVMALNEIAFPDLPQAEWDRFTRRLYREGHGGTPEPNYDPKIGEAMAQGAAAPRDLWPIFDALKAVPILVIRGATSDILARQTVEKMKARRADIKVAEIPNRGHAPLLNEPEAIQAIDAFLDKVAG